MSLTFLLALSAVLTSCDSPATPAATPKVTGTFVLVSVAGHDMPYPARPGGSAGQTNLVADTVTLASDSVFSQRRVYISSHPVLEDVVQRVAIHGTYTTESGTRGVLNVRLIYPDSVIDRYAPTGPVSGKITDDTLLLYRLSVFTPSTASEWKYRRR